jgi:predicted 3-demethylubiquinone-9 3-methyltransferase (glyoxalase superfamily)
MATTRQRIIPHLWFDREAKEATAFYASVFPDSAVTNVTTLHDTPSGDAGVVSFELRGHKFMAINGGPIFKPNPSISFIVNFDPLAFGGSTNEARRRLDAAWEKLAAGGTALMPLDKYPFSEHYGWVQDRYGMTWQLILLKPGGTTMPTIVPTLMFTGANAGKAEEAIEFYVSAFRNSRKGNVMRYGPGQEPDKPESLAHANFLLENLWFAAMGSAREHKFTFNEAISLMVNCDDQDEIDYYWGKLSAVPEAEQCGWLKDKFGVSWQVVPTAMEEMMRDGTKEQIARVTQAFLPTKKFDLATLRRAYAG